MRTSDLLLSNVKEWKFPRSPTKRAKTHYADAARSLATARPYKHSDQSAATFLQNQDSQLTILKMTVNSKICKKYPPSLKYQQAFLKSLIQKCESSNYDISDELYEAYTSLLSKPQPENDNCFRTYILTGHDCLVTLKESVHMISQGTTGLNTWPAASYMAEWALENKQVFSQTVVLELGSGMGLAGLVICRTCHPARYIFSDCHPSVLKLLRENISINVPGFPSDISQQATIGQQHSASHDEGPNIAVECIDWESMDEQDVQGWNAGVILATDVVYDTRIIESLVRVLRALLRCRGDSQKRPVAYVASTVRNEDTHDAFLKALGEHNISVEKMPGPNYEILPYDRSCPIHLLKLHAMT